MTYNVADELRSAARTLPGARALIEAESGKERTYAELEARSNRVARALVASGLGRGDRVIYFGHNRVEFFELLFGCAKLGVTLAPLNWTLSDDEVATLVADLGATLAVVDDTFADRVEVATKVVVGAAYEEWVCGHGEEWFDTETGADDVVLQPYTSGTTGVPKGVRITHGGVDTYLLSTRMLGFDGTSVLMASMPNYHIGGCVFPLLAVSGGGHMVIVNRFSASTVLDMIDEYRITNINLVPTMIQMIIEEQLARPRDVKSLRLIVYGAAPVTERTIAMSNDVLGVSLGQMYASTECLGITFLFPDDHRGDLLRSVGRAMLGVDIEIRDPRSGAAVEVGERGEICVRSGQTSAGYWSRPVESARLLTDDGWVRTGDTGYLDADGFLYLTDRVNDMMITGGENVYPTEVEAVLTKSPDVAEVVVLGLPDEKWGDLVVACVVPTDATSFSAEALLSWSAGQLIGYRRPREVFVMTEIPRNPTGKVLRREIRGALLQQRDQVG